MHVKGSDLDIFFYAFFFPSRISFQSFVFVVSLLVCIVVSVAGGRHSRRDRCDGLEDGTLIANPKGCKYFFACKSGTSKGGHCPRGLWFNAETVECDLPAHVKCHFDDPVPTITATSLQPTEASPPTASESATMSPSITDRPTATTNASPISDGHDEVVCPQQDTHTIQFVASKIDCRHYYICYHGSAVRQECSAELHWNAETNKCVSIANAGCNVSI